MPQAATETPTAKIAPIVDNGRKTIGNKPVEDQKSRLKNFVERIEKLDDQRANLNADIRDIYSSAEDAGFDKKALKQVLKLRRMDQKKRELLQDTVDQYLVQLDMLPLFETAGNA